MIIDRNHLGLATVFSEEAQAKLPSHSRLQAEIEKLPPEERTEAALSVLGSLTREAPETFRSLAVSVAWILGMTLPALQAKLATALGATEHVDEALFKAIMAPKRAYVEDVGSTSFVPPGALGFPFFHEGSVWGSATNLAPPEIPGALPSYETAEALARLREQRASEVAFRSQFVYSDRPFFFEPSQYAGRVRPTEANEGVVWSRDLSSNKGFDFNWDMNARKGVIERQLERLGWSAGETLVRFGEMMEKEGQPTINLLLFGAKTGEVEWVQIRIQKDGGGAQRAS